MIPFIWGIVAGVVVIAVAANYVVKREKKHICQEHGELKNSCAGCRRGGMWD